MGTNFDRILVPMARPGVGTRCATQMGSKLGKEMSEKRAPRVGFAPLDACDSNARSRSFPFNPHGTDLLNRHLGRRPPIVLSDLMLLALDGGRSTGYLNRIRGRVNWLPRSSGKLNAKFGLDLFPS